MRPRIGWWRHGRQHWRACPSPHGRGRRVTRSRTAARAAARARTPSSSRVPPEGGDMAIYERIADLPRRRYRVSSPVTLAAIGEFECASAEEVRAAVESARKAQASWARLTVKERAAYMWRLLDQFVKRQDELVDAVIQETGKPRSEAIGMEVFACCDAISFYAKRAARFLAPEKRRIHGLMGFAKRLRLVYKPLGVVGLIT